MLVWYLQLEDSDQPILPGDMPRIGEAVIWAQLGDGVAAILPGGLCDPSYQGSCQIGEAVIWAQLRDGVTVILPGGAV